MTVVVSVGVDLLLLFGGEEFEPFAVAGETELIEQETEEAEAAAPAVVSTTISRQKQGRHVQGDPLHDGTGKSYLNSQADAQRVLDAYHSGDATVLGRTSNGNIVVRYDGVTGYNNNPGAGFLDQPTNVFMIKGTRSPSIVPINPNWTP